MPEPHRRTRRVITTRDPHATEPPSTAKPPHRVAGVRHGADGPDLGGRRGVRRVRQIPDPTYGPAFHLMVEARDARAVRVRQQRRQEQGRIMVLLAVIVVLVGLLAFTRPGLESDAEPDTASASVTVPAPAERQPTPVLANYRSMRIRVPIDPTELSEIAFHQASYSNALRMETTMPSFDADKAEDKRGTGRPTDPTARGDGIVLGGKVLHLWRTNRQGPKDSAMDIGAAPGTRVYAPITGTVLEVRRYKLYNKYDDYQIHIRPDGWNDVDVVMIHVSDPEVVAGDKLVAGVTPVAKVRKLSHLINLQLARFTTESGDHVHVQVNKVKPGTTEAVGDS